MPVSKRPAAKPLLVGEANPYGGDPHFALYPAPDGCSGHRLCCLILGMRRADYLREFDRVNLCPHEWNTREAKARGQELWKEAVELNRPAIILLGRKVAVVFGDSMDHAGSIGPFEIETNCTDIKIGCLPHPSGLCRTWNEPNAFQRARDVVSRLLPSIAHLLGVAEVEDDE